MSSESLLNFTRKNLTFCNRTKGFLYFCSKIFYNLAEPTPSILNLKEKLKKYSPNNTFFWIWKSVFFLKLPLFKKGSQISICAFPLFYRFSRIYEKLQQNFSSLRYLLYYLAINGNTRVALIHFQIYIKDFIVKSI